MGTYTKKPRESKRSFATLCSLKEVTWISFTVDLFLTIVVWYENINLNLGILFLFSGKKSGYILPNKLLNSLSQTSVSMKLR